MHTQQSIVIPDFSRGTYYAVFRNNKPGSNAWVNAIGEHATRFTSFTALHAYYGKKVDVLSITMWGGGGGVSLNTSAAEPSRSLQKKKGFGRET
jgi:hypothetical protein